MSESRPNRKVKTLYIKNVNNHEESEYEFHEHMNLIVGSSETGKSASIRALTFALYNKYNGDLVNWDEKFAQVKVVFFDGAVIVRTKGKDINRVEFKYAGQKEFTVYKSFGSDYPEEVWKFLGDPPRLPDSEPIAYADQQTKLFLVDQKPTQLPTTFSQLTGVEDLEDCSSACNSKIKGYEKSNKALENEIKDLENELENNFSSLDQEVALLEEFEVLLSEISDIEKDITNLQTYLRDYNRIVKAGKEAQSEISKCKKLLDVLPNVNSLTKDFNDLQSMHNLFENAEKLSAKITKYENKIKIDRAITEGEFSTSITNCDLLLNTLLDMSAMLEKGIDINDKISKKNEIISKLNKSIKENTDDLESTISEAIEKGAICSACMKIGGEYVR
jgi:DNA repair exonuclease SbcCD ATPase subunit